MVEKSNVLLVFCTCPDNITAEQLAGGLVERNLAACVNVLPAISSIFYWQGKLEKEQETLLLIKTTRRRFEALRDWLVEAHPYENPEVIGLDVTAGAEQYLDWVASSCDRIMSDDDPDA